PPQRCRDRRRPRRRIGLAAATAPAWDTGGVSKRARRRSSAADEIFERLTQRLPHPARAIASRLRQEDLFLLSAALAFYALVSIAPFAILVLWLVALIVGDQEVRGVADTLARLLPPNIRVGEALQRVAELGTGLGVGALIALIWPATAYGSGLARAFERLSPGSDQPARGLRGRALALALVGLMPALTLAGLIAATVGSSLLGDGLVGTALGIVLALVFGFVASALAAAAIYRLFTPRRVRAGGIVRGAAAAGMTIALLSAGYALFLNAGTDFERRYASSGLAALVLLALWLFLANALILVGYQVAQDQ
ncbi:MAG: YihY/virulence factor BrkB family protein, partial [Actinomycetota bacterium]|nr:YihY/virulence factor BrkB family protein [Actinomycetota bacterium]